VAPLNLTPDFQTCKDALECGDVRSVASFSPQHMPLRASRTSPVSYMWSKLHMAR